jgi:hypothetical protein
VAITVDTVLAAGPHAVGVSFINDAYGGSPSLDRNLYVLGATYDGQPVAGAAKTLLWNGTDNFTVNVPSTPAPTVTSKAVINVSEDAYLGDAKFAVAIDGKPMGTYTATASHAAGQSQAISLTGIAENFKPHDIAITFLNDAYNGSPSQDRNLYVNSIQFDNQNVAGASATLLRPETAHFAAVAPANWVG